MAPAHDEPPDTPGSEPDPRAPGASAAPSHPWLRIDVRADGACWLTIDRLDKHNALARPLLAALGAAVRELGARPELRCLVVTGAGERYFAAGGDLRELARVRDEASVLAMAQEAGDALEAIRQCPVPVVALLNGDALGGGAELALACDMRLLAPHARIGFIQARLALTSAWGGGPDLFRLVGPSRAVRMMARAELVGAEQALAWGLADGVVRDGPDGEDARAFLQPLLGCAPQVLRGIKAQAIASREAGGWAAHRDVERGHFVRTWLHADHWAVADRILDKGG
jgi:enoyl-CoA hydratase